MNKCPICGKEKDKKKKFCGKECYTKWQLSDKNPSRNRKIANCKFCNKEFELKGYEKTKFCSQKCYGEYISKNKKIYNPILKKIKKSCNYCDKEFEIWDYRKNTTFFCSQKCHFMSKRITLICKNCHEPFTIPNWKNKNRKFCSQNCSNEYILLNNKSVWEEEIFNILIDYFDIKNNIRIYVGNSFLIPDIVYNNKIIELFGDYWHCNPLLYESEYYHKQIRKNAKEIWCSDNNRIKLLEKKYIIKIGWELDWKKDSNKFITECIKFLGE